LPKRCSTTNFYNQADHAAVYSKRVVKIHGVARVKSKKYASLILELGGVGGGQILNFWVVCTVEVLTCRRQPKYWLVVEALHSCYSFCSCTKCTLWGRLCKPNSFLCLLGNPMASCGRNNDQ
jgi:hypothetical protein